MLVLGIAPEECSAVSLQKQNLPEEAVRAQESIRAALGIRMSLKGLLGT